MNSSKFSLLNSLYLFPRNCSAGMTIDRNVWTRARDWEYRSKGRSSKVRERNKCDRPMLTDSSPALDWLGSGRTKNVKGKVCTFGTNYTPSPLCPSRPSAGCFVSLLRVHSLFVYPTFNLSYSFDFPLAPFILRSKMSFSFWPFPSRVWPMPLPEHSQLQRKVDACCSLQSFLSL